MAETEEGFGLPASTRSDPEPKEHSSENKQDSLLGAANKPHSPQQATYSQQVGLRLAAQHNECTLLLNTGNNWVLHANVCKCISDTFLGASARRRLIG